MRTLTRLGIVGLLACGLLLVAGAASGASSAEAKAGIDIPATVHGGQKIDIDVECPKSDTKARIHVSGGHIAMNAGISLDAGSAELSVKVPRLTPPGDYRIDLTCKPSKARASATTSVVI